MKRFIQKTLVLLLLAGMILSLASCAKTPAVHPEREERMDLSDGFTMAGGKNELTKIGENGRFILYANLRFGEVSVEDKENGKTWYSNPVDKSDDGLASGFYKNSLLSVITVVYETDQSVEMTCGGYMSSVTKDGLSYRIEPDGSIVFMFDFVKEMFRVPVRFSLEDDCFMASVITDWVAEYGPNRIKKIDLLPFFGAGNSDTEGYMLVPDGSGSLIYYNNGRLEASTFEKALYGFDNGTSDRVLGGAAASGSITLSENACLPVFGVHQDTQGFLAVIGGGRARAGINANVAGKYTNYNTVWSEYSYRTYGTVRQIQKDGSDLAVTVAEKTLETFEDYEVRYYFLPEGASDYADMAGLYRDLLIRDGLLKPRVSEGDIPLYADLYGYLKKTKSFLGMPVQASITTGSVNDASLFVDRLSEAGLRNLVVKYNYWSKGSYFGKIPSVPRTASEIGTDAALMKLRDKLAGQGGLYLSADLVNVYQTGRGITQYDGVLQSVANTVQRQYALRLDNAAVDSRYQSWFLLRPSIFEDVFGDYADDFTKAGYTLLSADNLGSMLYSELGSKGTGRNEALRIMERTAALLEEKTEGLMLEGGNDYAAVHAAHVVGTPARDSGYDLEDVSVPFWQMVFHGYVNYSLGAMNLSSNPSEQVLRSLEYGASPFFSLVLENPDELIGSRLDRLYSARAEDWTDYMGKAYRQINTALREASASVIVSHEIVSSQVRKVLYDNGLTVYVNYGVEKASADGLEIPAEGFTVVKNGSLVLSEAAAREE